MAILLPGGAGFIGSHTAVELLNKGREIIIIDNFSNSTPKSLEAIKKITGKDFKFYEMDYMDKEKLEKEPAVKPVKEVKVIYNEALRMFEDGEVSEVNIVYTKFTSPVKQDVTVERLLPVECDLDSSNEISIEPDYETVLKASLDAYLKGKIRYYMLSSRCSEESSRMNAMDGATSNANDIINSLNVKYNRIRQAMITNEISEIVGGASAQK